MDAYQTHGAFSWSELTTSDPGKATEFYGTLFGWKVENMDMGTGPYYVVKVGETGVGGIMGFPPGVEGVPPNWCPVVTVKDVDETARQCTSMGGKVLAGPLDVPTVGRYAVLQDPQGAAISVITYSMPG